MRRSILLLLAAVLAAAHAFVTGRGAAQRVRQCSMRFRFDEEPEDVFWTRLLDPRERGKALEEADKSLQDSVKDARVFLGLEDAKSKPAAVKAFAPAKDRARPRVRSAVRPSTLNVLERAKVVRRMLNGGITEDEWTPIAKMLRALGADVEKRPAQPNIRYKEDPSYLTVPRDIDGTPLQAKFVYVDENICIGCTYCNGVAPDTFFMEDENGRARVFRQDGDDEETIDTAIQSCPVECIFWVDYENLLGLETERDQTQKINIMASLVGSQAFEGRVERDRDREQPKSLLQGGGAMRCPDCPSRKCANCPMYAVGSDSKYVMRKLDIAARKRKMAQRKRLGPDQS